MKLTDFGLSKNVHVENPFDSKSYVTGTPIYCSPERLNGVHNSDKDDNWALGCIVYELSELQHPFKVRDQEKRK